MRLVKQLSLFTVLLLILGAAFFSLASCVAETGDGEEGGSLLQGSSEGVDWSLILEAGPYGFSDRIPFEITLASNGKDRSPFNDPGFRPAEDNWGDFRVRRLSAMASGYKGELVPRRTGECSLVIPVYAVSEASRDGERDRLREGSLSGETLRPLFVIKPGMTFQVESVLTGDEQEPAGLLPEEESHSPFLLIPSIIGAASAAGLALFFILRRRKAVLTGQEEHDLETFLDEHKELSESEDPVILYRSLFHLLLAGLELLHPGLKGHGYGPLELKAVLEEPSSLNQWNLRSLYPLLERMEELFFSPHPSLPDSGEYREHRTLLAGWLAVLKEDTHEN